MAGRCLCRLVGSFLPRPWLSPRPSPAKSILTPTFCLLLSFAGLLNLYLPQEIVYRGGKVISGGLIGYLLSRFMTNFLNDFGACVILGGIFIISFMVITDASFGWLFSNLYSWGNTLLRQLKEISLKKTERKGRRGVVKNTLNGKKRNPSCR